MVAEVSPAFPGAKPAVDWPRPFRIDEPCSHQGDGMATFALTAKARFPGWEFAPWIIGPVT